MSAVSRDHFEQDAARRDALQQELYGVRLALWEAHESQDGAAALDALKRMYKLLEQLPDAQVLYVGGEAEATFSLPATCRQMTAKFGGRCVVCETWVSKGSIMYWEPESREMFCVACGGIPGLAR